MYTRKRLFVHRGWCWWSTARGAVSARRSLICIPPAFCPRSLGEYPFAIHIDLRAMYTPMPEVVEKWEKPSHRRYRPAPGTAQRFPTRRGSDIPCRWSIERSTTRGWNNGCSVFDRNSRSCIFAARYAAEERRHRSARSAG